MRVAGEKSQSKKGPLHRLEDLGLILRLPKLLEAGHEVMLSLRHRSGKTEAGGPLRLASITPFVNSRFSETSFL